ncbi:MAG: hypothetical protein JNK65_00580 [Deltaproteobacteria bacterium]|nr:hypothetical protein [Deltaproteobacteria bacterium]
MSFIKPPPHFYSRRFLYLFLALLLPFMLHPLANTELMGVSLLDLAFSIVLLMVLFAVSERRHITFSVLALVLVVQIMTWTTHFIPNQWLIRLGIFLNIFYLTYTTALILSHVINSKKVSSNTLFAALCIYILIGYIWAFIYSLIDIFSINAFQMNPNFFMNVPAGKHIFSKLYYFIYFSFTTLTTLNFGDIIPANPWARVFSTLEAIVGQLYLVVLVSRLVGMHINQVEEK